MKKFFDKQPVWFAVIWIVVYVLAFGNADTISESLGVPKLITAVVGLVLTVVLLLFLRKQNFHVFLFMKKISTVLWVYFIRRTFTITVKCP